MSHLGIIIPSFNSALTLKKTLQRIPVQKLKTNGISIQIYIVNDGSTDDTLAIASNFINEFPFKISLINHEKNQGYGASQKSGLIESLKMNNDYHVILHSDGQYAPEELPEISEPLLSGKADIVIGSKFLKGKVLEQGMPFFRYLGIKLIDQFENFLFHTKNLEFHSGYMAYSSTFLKELTFSDFTNNFHFDGEMVLTAARKSFKITKVPISTYYDSSISSLRIFPYLIEIFKSNLRNIKNPNK